MSAAQVESTGPPVPELPIEPFELSREYYEANAAWERAIEDLRVQCNKVKGMLATMDDEEFEGQDENSEDDLELSQALESMHEHVKKSNAQLAAILASQEAELQIELEGDDPVMAEAFKAMEDDAKALKAEFAAMQAADD